MGAVWTDQARFEGMLRVEIAVARAEVSRGMVPAVAVRAIEARAVVDVERIAEIEKTTDHDVIAFVSQLAEKVGELADEGDDVVVGSLLDLGDPLDIDDGARLDGPHGYRRNHAAGDLRPGHGDLYPEHALEARLVGPDGAHFGQRVSRNQRSPSAGSLDLPPGDEAPFRGELVDVASGAFVGACSAVGSVAPFRGELIVAEPGAFVGACSAVGSVAPFRGELIVAAPGAFVGACSAVGSVALFVQADSDTGSGDLAPGETTAGSLRAMSWRRCMPGHVMQSAAFSAAARAAGSVAPKPTTARTRPPFVRKWPLASLTVPAWNTVAPAAAASASPEMASPLRGFSG